MWTLNDIILSFILCDVVATAAAVATFPDLPYGIRWCSDFTFSLSISLHYHSVSLCVDDDVHDVHDDDATSQAK